MAGLQQVQLKAILGPRSSVTPALQLITSAMQGGVACVEDAAGKRLLGNDLPPGVTHFRAPVRLENTTLGWVSGTDAGATNAMAALVEQLAAKEAERRALASEVLNLYREVHLIEQLSEQLAALLDLSSVGRSALDQARRLIAASHGGIFIVDKPGDPLRAIASFGEADVSAGAGELMAAVLERGVGEIVNESGGAGSAILCAPLRAKQRAVGVIAMANSDNVPYSSANLKLLNTIALQTAAAIENSFLCADMVTAVRDREQLAALQKELDTARTIQLSLVPRTFPPFPQRTDFEIHAQMTAARSVGGDFFDFFLIDNDHLGVVIGDVSGKGIPAALYMAVTRTQIKTTALEGNAPEDCLREVNRVLVREKASSMFATCFYGILNTSSGEFRYCNAGHNPPQLLRADGVCEPLSGEGGLPLGLFDGLPYTGATARLAPGDAIFLFTDGVPEANNSALDDFSDERLNEVLRSVAHLPCDEMIRVVESEVLTFAAGAPQSDDITMLSLRMRGSRQD